MEPHRITPSEFQELFGNRDTDLRMLLSVPVPHIYPNWNEFPPPYFAAQHGTDFGHQDGWSGRLGAKMIHRRSGNRNARVQANNPYRRNENTRNSELRKTENQSLTAPKYVRPNVVANLPPREFKCHSCDLSFPADSTGQQQYGEHLDWHFKENRRKKEASKQLDETKKTEDDNNNTSANKTTTIINEQQNSSVLPGSSGTETATGALPVRSDSVARDVGRQHGRRERPELDKPYYRKKDTQSSAPKTIRKIRPKIAVKSVQRDLKCQSCQLTFPFDEFSQKLFREHLDWHFQENAQKREAAKLPEALKWEKTILSVPAAKDNNTCYVCSEVFDEFFHQEEGEWHLKDAIRLVDLTFHHLCFKDFISASKISAVKTEQTISPSEELN